jgi:hypothetical protein
MNKHQAGIMHVSNRLLCLLAALAAVLPALAQTLEPETPANAGSEKYSNEFLTIGVGARAFGMGNTQVAVADDVTAGYWNPAALASRGVVPYPEVSLMHASYFANIAAYSYAGFAMPVDSAGGRRFAASIIRMGIDDIPNTLNLIEPDGTINYDRIQSFSETQLALFLSYSWRIEQVEGLGMGASMKIIYRGVGQFANAWGFGLDLGLRYVRGPLMLGVAVTDVTHTFTAWTFNTETFEDAFIQTGNVVPQNSIEVTRPALRTGLGYELRLARRLRLLMASDLHVFLDGNRSSALLKGGGASLDPRFGAELALLNSQYRKVAFLRGGAYNIQNIVDADGQSQVGLFPTAGAGIVLRNFQIDYALANIGNLSENLHSHVVSLKFHIQ